MIAIERIDHLVLTVRDIAATCEFYRRALGMEVVVFGEARTALHFGDHKINLHAAGREVDPKALRPTPGSADLCLVMSTPLSEAAAHLRTAGVALELGPVSRTGARGPIESLYFRDPDGNLIEVAVERDAADAIAPLRAWLREWEAAVRAVDFTRGRGLCLPTLTAFGTVAPLVEGLDAVEERQWRRVWPSIRDFTIRVGEARGGVSGGTGWVAAWWDSRGTRPDGSTFPRPGRLTVVLERHGRRWLARHTHFSLVPEG
jgi:catechol 2,3-dioxygenase-like lactoylglutathione lyase family enzyme/ketosteroid isomerase-like protein